MEENSNQKKRRGPRGLYRRRRERTEDAMLLSKARKKLGLTQAEMAEKLHYSRQATISDIEIGKKNMSPQGRALIKMILENHSK